MITYVGDLTLAASLPGPVLAADAGVAGIGLALPDIQARLDALLAFSPSPIDYAVNLTLAQQMVTSISAAIALGIPPPSMAAQIAAIQALIAELLANVSAINAHLGVITTFQSLLVAAGVHVYAYAGAVNAFGGELSTALSGGLPGGTPAELSNGLVLVTTVDSTWDAMSEVFKVTP